MPDERRRYFRIEDVVILKATPIDKDELDKHLDQFWAHPHQFSISNEYHLQMEQQIADFHAIKANMPELARYLSVQQKQIDLLSQKLLPVEKPSTEQKQQVNLSAQGILFSTDEKMHANDVVDLHLELISTGHKMSILARVIAVKDGTGDDQDQYHVSLDFEHIHDVDREALAKHIHNIQLREIANSKQPDYPIESK